MIDPTKYATKEELFAGLKANKDLLVAEKKSATKYSDAVSYDSHPALNGKDCEAGKALSLKDLLSRDSIKVTSVINTTNILDSHGDVHLPGLWTKSLKESKQFYLIKEHKFDFDHVISDNVTAYTQTKTWKELGFKWEGETQALVFESVIDKVDRTGMFERYANKKVKNHSVGMQYVKLALAINSDYPDYKEEKEVWDKYINEIINKDAAEAQGYFWAVTEAKVKEGSAVLRGSNIATPTVDVEPSDDTRKRDEPPRALKENIFTKVAKSINN